VNLVICSSFAPFESISLPVLIHEITAPDCGSVGSHNMPISPYYSRTIFQHAKFDQRDLLERMLRIAQLLWQHPWNVEKVRCYIQNGWGRGRHAYLRKRDGMRSHRWLLPEICGRDTGCCDHLSLHAGEPLAGRALHCVSITMHPGTTWTGSGKRRVRSRCT
jgi:hypothetical protein